MRLLTYNHKFALFGKEDQLVLREIPTFEKKGELNMRSKMASLQYGTGIAGIVAQSKVRMYDFIFSKDIYQFQSYLKIQNIGLIKNLLIVISQQRILIHDLKTKTNQCYIPIELGSYAFILNNYYRLRIAYYLESHLLANRQIWLNKVGRIQGVKFTLGAYSSDGNVVALALKNVLSLYEQNEIVKIYGFDLQILELVSLDKYFFVKLGDGQIIGCSIQNQVRFLQHTEIENDFWNQQYESVLMSDSECLYDIGMGIIKQFKLKYAQVCNFGESKNTKKQQQQAAITSKQTE